MGADNPTGKAAEQLIRIAADLRSSGSDLALVQLLEDGVSPVGVTLAGELELIAVNLDWDAAMAVSAELRERDGGAS